MLYTIKEEHPEAVKMYLTPIIGQWNEAFVTILNKRTAEVPEIEVAEWGLKTEILKVSAMCLLSNDKFAKSTKFLTVVSFSIPVHQLVHPGLP